MVAEVESQVTAISYQKPVIIEKLNIFPGQEVRVGDTLLIVSRPDLSLDLERKYNELDRTQSEIKQIIQNHESKRALLQIETESKLSRLSTEKLELETKLSQDKEISTRLSGRKQTNNLRRLIEIHQDRFYRSGDPGPESVF